MERSLARVLLVMTGVACGPSGGQNQGFSPPAKLVVAEAPRVELQGTVVDVDGKPIEGAQIRVLPRWRKASTDAEGRWSMRVGPPHGQILELFAHAEGYTVARTTVGLPSAPQDGQELKCSLRLRPAHTLQGLYLDGQGGQVPGARLGLRCLTPSLSREERHSWNTVLSDPAGFDLASTVSGSGAEAGEFSWTGLPDGLYEVFVLAEPQQDAAEDGAQAPTGPDHSRATPALAAARIVFRQGQADGAEYMVLTEGRGVFELAGSVHNGFWSGWVDGARVVAERLDGSLWASTRVDSRGVFRFPGMPGWASDWTLRVEAEGRVSEQTGSLVTTGPMLAMGEPRVVRFRLRDALGKPVLGASVLSLGTTGGRPAADALAQLSVRSDRNGLLRLPGLPAAEAVVLQIWSPWRCTPHELKVDLTPSPEDPDALVDLALPGDHSSPRFSVPIQLVERGGGWGDLPLTITAYSEERAIVGEWQLRALAGSPASPPRYLIHLGGAPQSVHARIVEAPRPEFEAQLPAGSYLMRAQLGDRVVGDVEVEVQTPFGADASPLKPVQLVIDAQG